jgi:hypothetical protein
MKRLFVAAISLTVILPTYAQDGDGKHWKKIVAKAEALPLKKCEVNDGMKGWRYPNDEPIGSLPLYRCTHEGKSATATFTQSPDGAEPRELVVYCMLVGRALSKTKCEAVPGERPAHRTADLAKFGIKEHMMEEITCEQALGGTMPISVCNAPREKRPLNAKKK